ncbi:MAG: hypothetical protein ABIP55_12705 [Tepidisphaeraceae bacterium]
MAKDPLKIMGVRDPTLKERKQAEALSKQVGWSLKLCRWALVEAHGNVAKAVALLQKQSFIVNHADYDDVVEGRKVDAFVRKRAAEKAAQGPTEEQRREAVQFEAGQARLREYNKRAAKARGTMLNDPVFGTIKWDEFWEGCATFPAFGKMDFTIETGAAPGDVAVPPTDGYRVAFEGFRASAERLYAAVQQANFKYFRRVRPEYVRSFGAEYVPNVKSATDLWKELGRPTLHLPPQRGKSWRVEINWSCSWDEEHGHAAYIRDGKVARLGLQGED